MVYLGTSPIPGKLRLDLFNTIKNKNSITFLLSGDNGTGKSSIVDAIEFVLQGHVEQSKFARGTSNNYSIKSFSSDNLPSVKAFFSDGTSIHRFVMQDDDGMLVNFTKPHPKFSISPFVIRRKDILRFWDTPGTERQLIFWNYLRKPGHKELDELVPEKLKRLQLERLQIKKKRDYLRQDLAKKIGVQLEEIPFTKKEIDILVNDKVYLGLKPKTLSQRGVRLKTKVNIDELDNLISNFLDVAKKHTAIKSRIKSFSVVPDKQGFPRHLLTEMNDFLEGIQDRLTKSFKKVSTNKFIDQVICSYVEVGRLSLHLEVKLVNGQVCLPQHVLSEANLDLLALLFFIALSEESHSRGQTPFLILDDVLQSIDSTIRFSFMDYLFNELPGWNFFITVHDKLWKSQLKSLLEQHKHICIEKEIFRWNFIDGPLIRHSSSLIEEPLKHAIKEAQQTRICSEAGFLLEQVCHHLSFNLPISVTRRKDDRYTLGELWPGVYKKLKKSNISIEADEVNKWMYLRNLIGAHYNEWAMSLSITEAENFGEAVLKFLSKVYCSNCFNWIKSSNNKNTSWECRCSRLNIYL